MLTVISALAILCITVLLFCRFTDEEDGERHLEIKIFHFIHIKCDLSPKDDGDKDKN